MGKYKFTIEAYYATDKDYLEIDEYEKELFNYNGRRIMLKAINKGKKIKDADGIEIECGIFSKIEDCIDTAKKVYANFLIRLNNTCISFILDKFSKGNFEKYYQANDANVYKEIIIVDINSIDEKIYSFLKMEGSGCTHFYFDKILDMEMDNKLKDSLVLNNYRKFLINNDIQSKVDNTLIAASIEMLLDHKEERDKEELKVIDEVCKYLESMYEERKNEAYCNIKKMIQNNKHKPIGSKIQKLIEQTSDEKEKKFNIKKMKKITQNRTKEVHVSKEEKPKRTVSWNVLNTIQSNYAKELYKKINKGTDDC